MTTEKRETTNLEWLNSISPIKDQPWQHEKVIRIDEEVMLPFYELYKNLKVSPLLRIIDALRGSNIPRYNNRVKDILDIKKYKPFLRKQKHRLISSQ